MIGGRGLCPQTPAVAPSAALHPASGVPHADLTLLAQQHPLPDQAGFITEWAKLANLQFVFVCV